MLCWIARSYVFAAFVLLVVAVFEHGLAPSVAFIALVVFLRLEGFLRFSS